MYTVILLTASNVFMTFAWYAHLKHRDVPLWKAILGSWAIAFFEYCLMVPANRLGADTFSTPQLKIMQEAITLTVFGFFVTFYLGEQLRWNHIVSFVLILGAVFFAFQGEPPKEPAQHEAAASVRR